MTQAEFNAADAQVISVVNGQRRHADFKAKTAAEKLEEKRLHRLILAARAERILMPAAWAVICLVLAAFIVIPLVPNKILGIVVLIALEICVQSGAIILDRYFRGSL